MIVIPLYRISDGMSSEQRQAVDVASDLDQNEIILAVSADGDCGDAPWNVNWVSMSNAAGRHE
jgi:hypothetical protein